MCRVGQSRLSRWSVALVSRVGQSRWSVALVSRVGQSRWSVALVSRVGQSRWSSLVGQSRTSQSRIFLGRVRILIKILLNLNFDRFTMEKMSKFIFNQILMSIRTRP
jgi:hypothetical protein